jgi:rhamnopyranosyl-N-acetylglucosaminyl-diphospho-decaprenol beta-1,3/1,4-galactofuranosyltransferase
MKNLKEEKKLISAGIVTFNRRLLFIDCLNSLLNQNQKPNAIYIYDNASNDGTTEFILDTFFKISIQKLNYESWIKTEIDGLFLFYKKAKENLGSSMGFYELSKKMFEDGYNYLLITDDDVVFKEDYLENLLNFAIKNNYSMVTSLMVNNFEDLKVKGSSPIFAGGLVSREVFEKIGFPEKDYFIYWDDVEFILRAEKNGFKIEVCNNAFCVHDQNKLYKDIKVNKIKFLFWEKEYSNVNDWKIYYAYRNMVITLLIHKKFIDLAFKVIRAFILAFAFLFYKEKNKFILILLGLKDGFLFKKGKNPYVFKFK